MDADERKLLEETAELTKENNRMLHSMRRSMVVSRILNFLYWAIIIGSAIGAYYFLQPYIDKVTAVYNSASDVIKNFKQ